MNPEITQRLIRLFGSPKKLFSSIAELEFNCPECDEGKNKYNLNVNIAKNVYHCWACDRSGGLKKLFKIYGTSDDVASVRTAQSRLRQARTTVEVNGFIPTSIQIAPSETVSLLDVPHSIHHLAAKKYLVDRGITEELIQKWDICYSEFGRTKFRVVIPYINNKKQWEFYVARAFYDSIKPKYRNPTGVAKNEVIFGEDKVNWKIPLVIVEGVFDSLVLYNAIPLLGSSVKGHKKLLSKIIKNSTPIILCLDQDAWNKQRQIYSYLTSFGIKVKIIQLEEAKDLSEAYVTLGKKYVIDLIRSSTSPDPIDLIKFNK
jgi:DNA primase